jgi:hypothetical protein
MRIPRVLAVFFCLAVFGVATSHADSVIGYFDLGCTSGNCAPGQDAPTPIATVGQVIFTLNANGTVAATLDDYGPAVVSGFGFDSCFCNLPESGFTPGTPDNAFGWGDAFGSQYSGFGSYATFGVPLIESWTIGNPGDYTSVYQVINGAFSSVDFFLTDSNGSYGADGKPYTPGPIPEPGSLLLLGTGALALLGTLRRKLVR